MLKSFATTMIIASASAMNVVSVPEWMAGFIYGMAGSNHLDELKSCFDGSEALVLDAKQAFEHIIHGNIIKGAKEADKVFHDFPAQLAACKGTHEDTIAISQWAETFKHPEHLMKLVTEHYMIHRKAVNKDIAAEKADWSAKNYFTAGVDMADAFTILVGPMNKSYLDAKFSPKEVTFSASSIPKFVAGFIYKFVGDNNLSAIEGCWTQGSTIEKEIVKGVSLLKKGGKINYTRGILALKNAAFAIPAELKTCKAMTADLKAIEQWAAIFTSKTKLEAKIAKNLALHHKAITTDISALETDVKGGNPFKAGEDAADLLAVAIGTVEEEAPVAVAAVDCTSGSDITAWDNMKDDMTNNMTNCAGLSSVDKCTSIFKLKADCVSNCMAHTDGFSASCSTAFGTLAECGFTNCKSACITGPTSEGCVTCNEQKCTADFHASTGFTVDCKYYKACNGTSKSLKKLENKIIDVVENVADVVESLGALF